MKPARVLIVHPYVHVGGPDTFVTNVVRCLGARGWRFWIVLSKERPLAGALRDLGVAVVIDHSLETLPRTSSPVRLTRHVMRTRQVVATLRALVISREISVVHAVHETMWTVLQGLRNTGTGRVASVHGMRFTSPKWAGAINTRMLSSHADRIVCVSDVVRHLLLDWSVPARKLSLVPSSVDLRRFRPGISGMAFRRELGIGSDTLLAGTVGSVDERKGHAYFIETCARIHERRPDVRFAIVGHGGDDGPAGQATFLQDLRARAEALGLGECLSFVPARSDIPQVMAALDVLVQPSLTEAGPRAPLEAMAMERPVVGTRIEGIAEEVVDGETGILVDARDSVALADAVDDLLSDPDKRTRMGRAGRIRVEQRYSLDATARLIEDAYGGAIVERRH
jgi:glycosyltransferase involved in cell wall biosynthesis